MAPELGFFVIKAKTCGNHFDTGDRKTPQGPKESVREDKKDNIETIIGSWRKGAYVMYWKKYYLTCGNVVNRKNT